MLDISPSFSKTEILGEWVDGPIRLINIFDLIQATNTILTSITLYSCNCKCFKLLPS